MVVVLNCVIRETLASTAFLREPERERERERRVEKMMDGHEWMNELGDYIERRERGVAVC